MPTTISPHSSLPRRVIDRLTRDSVYVLKSAKAAVCRNRITAYWADFENFGDQITPLLLRFYGLTPFLAQPAQAQIVSTGSILEHIPESYSGMVLGTGLISQTSQRSFPFAKIAALRGKLTQDRLGLSGKNIKLGDPGLLASMVLKEREEKRYVLGLIPHYVDKTNAALQKLANENRRDVTIINVQVKNSLQVIKQINQCSNIISSSLHGLIVADSLGTPNAWMYSPGLTGGRFKFDDYYSSLAVPDQNPIEVRGCETVNELLKMVTAKPIEVIEARKQGLNELFSSLGK